MVDSVPMPPSQVLTAPAEAATPQEVIRQGQTAQDYVVLRIAVTGLLLALVFAIAGTIYLTAFDKTVPDGLIAVGSAAVGALATMLVRPQSA